MALVSAASAFLQAHPKVFSLLLLRRDLPLRCDCLLLLLFWLHLRRVGAAVRNIMPQRGAQLLAVVGEDLRVVCAARNGNVGHAIIEQVFGSQLGIGVNQHTVGGLPQAGMARDRVKLFEFQMQRWCHNILLRNTPMQKPGERLMQFLMALGLNLEMQ